MKVIGTAGHIDHGKSTLVRRLTGIDPDRLEEEKRRGMTIDLGFAWLTLPSGVDISIVDVPGHERFVKNMLAGAAGIDVALLVVALDEGVMPQTREHLDIIDLLEVKHGVVALTKSDLVDDEWAELAADDVRDALAGTGLQGCPMVPVSSQTGAGLDVLLAALDAAVAAAPNAVDRQLPFLPIDRVFTVTGFGTVITGTLHSGSFRTGDEVEIVPGRRRARIRTLQTHQHTVEFAEPGTRLAVNLVGTARDEIQRGDLVALPGTIPPSRRLDARLRVLPTAPFPLGHGTEVTVHIGAAERAAIVTLLDGGAIEPGEAGWAQLRLQSPVGAVRGQRFILRLPAPARTVAGGEIVDTMPRHRRSDATAISRLELLASQVESDAVLAAVTGERPRTSAQISRLVGIGVATVEQTLIELAGRGQTVRVGPGHVSAAAWESFQDRASRLILAYLQIYPVRRGMPKEELRRRLGWEPAAWSAALKKMAEAGVVKEDGSTVATPEHLGGTARRREEADRVLAVLCAARFSPPVRNELLERAETDLGVLLAMAEEGAVVRVGPDLFFLPSVYDEMLLRTVRLLRSSGEVTVAQVRDTLGTTRKYTLAFLEHLDGQRITRRVGDVRVMGSKAPTCT